MPEEIAGAASETTPEIAPAQVMAAASTPEAPQEAPEFQLERFTVAVTFAPPSANDDARTIDAVWYTGAKVPRFDWRSGEEYDLILDMKGCRMDRLNNGGPLLDSHSAYGVESQLGVVRKAWAKKGNIPLAALFCEPRQTRPVSKISIPEAVLDTDTSRFSTMPGLGWPLTVSIVAADGCFYDEDSKKVVLYGNEEAVATNTNIFVQNTRHTVLFCLTSNKIKVGFAPNPNTGPPIRPPKKPVIRVLVTDHRYQRAVDTLTADDWLIVTEEADWTRVLARMEQGEQPPE